MFRVPHGWVLGGGACVEPGTAWDLLAAAGGGIAVVILRNACAEGRRLGMVVVDPDTLAFLVGRRFEVSCSELPADARFLYARVVNESTGILGLVYESAAFPLMVPGDAMWSLRVHLRELPGDGEAQPVTAAAEAAPRYEDW